ncbi:MAG: hypothetical protein KJ749_12860 [Planctomycetes bacterium]|nr:hypothetical protein [Planctomycetota bacterium]
MYSRTTGLRERGARRGGGANLYVSRNGLVWATVLAIAVGASYATAQTTAEPTPDSQNTPLQATQEAAPGGCQGDSGQPVTETKEGAKWFCETPTITHDKVWRGDPITCDFKIENKGTEPLKINAKGG